MAQPDETIPEKPYVLATFAGPEPRRARPPGHHALRADALSGMIVLRLTAIRPIQVASGSFDIQPTREGEQIVAMDSRVARYGDDGTAVRHSVLPGSSLKGALRSLVEAVSPSCVAVSAGATRFAIPDPLRRCGRVAELCPTCRLFGMSGAGRDNYQGQLSVEDATIVEGTGGRAIVRVPLLWAPARGRGRLPLRYLARGDKVFGRKIYRHSKLAKGPDARLGLRTGTQLLAPLHFENLAPAELGLLLAAFGLHPEHRFLPKIGAGKPVGMGSVAVACARVELYGPVRARGRMGGGAEVLDGEALDERVGGWVRDATTVGLLIEDALRQVHDALREANLERAPLEGVY